MHPKIIIADPIYGADIIQGMPYSNKILIDDPVVLAAVHTSSVAEMNTLLQREIIFDEEGELWDAPPQLTTPEMDALLKHYQVLTSGLEDQNKPGLDLSWYDLSNVTFRRKVDLRNSKFTHAILHNVYCFDGHFEGADFSWARMNDAKFLWSHFHRAVFNSAVMHRTSLRGSDLSDAKLNGANLREAVLLGNANLTRAELNDAELKDVLCQGVIIDNAQMHGVVVTSSIRSAISDTIVHCSHYFLHGERRPETGFFPVMNSDLNFDNEFDILGMLGSGASAELYKIYNPLADKYFAMRVLMPPATNKREIVQIKHHFAMINALAKQDPHIIHYYWAKLINDQVLAVFMEFIDGESLYEHMPKASQGQRLSWAEDVLRALVLCHERGITHNDLHPGNVMISSDGTIKLIDFATPAPGSAANPRDDIYSYTDIYMMLMCDTALPVLQVNARFGELPGYLLPEYRSFLKSKFKKKPMVEFLMRCISSGVNNKERDAYEHFRTITEAYEFFMEHIHSLYKKK